MSVTGFWILDTIYWLLVSGYWFTVPALRCQMTDDRSQMTDDRSQMTDDRSQMTDDRSQKTDIGLPNSSLCTMLSALFAHNAQPATTFSPSPRKFSKIPVFLWLIHRSGRPRFQSPSRLQDWLLPGPSAILF